MRKRASLAVLFVVVFVDLLGFGMVIPTMPLYAEGLGAPKEWIGLLMAVYALMQFVFAPFWGQLSDRFGRRPLLLVSIAMSAVAFTGYAVAPSFGWLLASRAFAGAATANIPIAQAYVADVTPPEGRARGMGLIGAAFGLGFVLGPAIGGLLSGISLGAPGWAAAGLSLANGVAAFFILAEPERRVASGRRGRVAALVEELGRPGIWQLLACYFLSVLAFSAMEATFALLARERYSLDQQHVNYVFAYIGVLVVVMQGGLVGPLARRFGEVRLLVAGTILQALARAALPYAPGSGGLLAACVPLAAGSGLTQPALAALISRSARAEDQGGTLGIGQSASAIGRILGPEAGTWTFSRWPAVPYLAGAGLMAVAAALGATLRRATPPDS